MDKILYLSLIASAYLWGSERVELFGTVADANGTKVHVTGNPVASYQDQLLSAQELFYDRNTSVVEAHGNVNAYKAGQYHVISDYSKFNMDEDIRYSKPYYMIDQLSGVWMNTEEATACKNEINLESGMVSGCDSTDPLWKIRFSSADYDTNEMWVNLYNARLYIEDVPVFYLPYFGYPTDKTRRSGLLLPLFGFSSGEGFYYEQPIYFAPSHWWDIEFRPQIRTNRGEGMYTDLRFVDTPYSRGSVKGGFFKEQSGYAEAYDLAHIKHYGYEVDYRNSSVLKEWFGLNLDGESGMFVNGSWMNDVDYLNLKNHDETQNITANQVYSRINGYYNSEDNYVGVYLKHYQYLDQASNSRTIQTLPSLQYHRYLETFLDDHMLINADASLTHYYRREGKRALQGDFSLPVILQSGWFDNYIDASYTADMKGRFIAFYSDPLSGENSSYEPGYYGQLDHTFALGTTLVKGYENMTHVLAPSISYTLSGNRFYEGYYKKFHANDTCIPGNTDPACDYYNLTAPSNLLSIGLNNYLLEEGEQFLADRLSQSFQEDEFGSYYGELQNELEWQITKAISYYNLTAYNHDRNRITKERNTLRYNGDVINAGINHYYSDELRATGIRYTSYWSADAAYQYSRHTKVFGSIDYDYREDILKQAQVGFLYRQRCWDFGIRFVQNRRPILTALNGIESLSDSYLFFTIILKPLGGSEFNYRLTE